MTDVKPADTTPKKEEPKVEFIYARDHGKSMDVIAHESLKEEEELKKKLLDKSQEPEEVKKEETPIEPKKEEPVKEEPKVDVEKIKKEAAAEAAAIAKEEAKKEFQAEINKILEANKDIEEKQKQADELISIFEKEKRLPTDYKEVLSESQRLAEAKYKQLAQADKEKQQAAEKAQKAAEEKAKTDAQLAYEAKVADINQRVVNELKELTDGKFIKDQTESDDLMKFGIDLNTKRAKEGLAPIDSVTKLYFMHYKPTKGAVSTDQPAGADAPVAGNKTAKVATKLDGFVYARDHNKDFRQILAEEMQSEKP